jgi:hypothetical protein
MSEEHFATVSIPRAADTGDLACEACAFIETNVSTAHGDGVVDGKERRMAGVPCASNCSPIRSNTL